MLFDKPKTSARLRAISRDFSDKSTAVTVAAFRAKFIVSVPMPQPISRTRFFRQREKSANCGICGSTKYFFFSTSSKYFRGPGGFVEWRILHGLRAQEFR